MADLSHWINVAETDTTDPDLTQVIEDLAHQTYHVHCRVGYDHGPQVFFDLLKLEIVMNEMRKNQNFHFDLQIHPTLNNSTYLYCQMTGFIPIRVQNFQNVE